MKYRKAKNRKEIWDEYCLRNSSALQAIGLDYAVYKNEANFIEYATSGNLNGHRLVVVSPGELDNEKFWLLHRFITEYFDFDAIAFENYEASRVSRG